MHPPLELIHETTGRASAVSPGLWVLATRHRGGGFSLFPEVNNRAFIFRLEDAHTQMPVLAVLNATDPKQSFAEVERLGEQTQLEVGYVISCGGAHHSYLGAWQRQFQSATILLGAERIPRTQNGQKLLQLQRVGVMDPGNPLPMFAGQLEAVTFTGLLGAREFASPTEGGKNSTLRALAAMRQLAAPTDHYDQLWVYHRASGTIVAGENLAPYVSAHAHDQMSFLLRKTLKREKLAIAKAIWDSEAVVRGWRAVTQWPASNLLGVHDAVGSGFHGDVAAALTQVAREAGQLPDA